MIQGGTKSLRAGDMLRAYPNSIVIAQNSRKVIDE